MGKAGGCFNKHVGLSDRASDHYGQITWEDGPSSGLIETGPSSHSDACVFMTSHTYGLPSPPFCLIYMDQVKGKVGRDNQRLLDVMPHGL